MNSLDRHQPTVLSILRIMAGLLFLAHGSAKLLGLPLPQPGVPDPLPTMLVVAGAIELAGGTLLTLGLFTRFAAFVSSGQMAAAYFIGHASQGFWPFANGGDAAILFCFVFLYLVFAGPGPISVDAQLAKRRAPSPSASARPRQ